MRIKASARSFSGCGVRRVDEEDCRLLRGVIFDLLNSVAFNERDLLANVADILDPLLECLWVPAGTDSLAVLAVFEDTAARRENATVIRSVAE